ncbi:unnamed protein product [Brassica napus]|nr:unnamed protein product [Brassica napus]
MKKSLQLSFTFLIIFIILSQGMMADAQKKNCPHKIPITGSYCIPTKCLDMCKKQHGTTGSCSEEKGFCNCACK